MEWRTDNFIADMYGPSFLIFYGAVIAATIAASWWMMRQRDSTTGIPPPDVPSEPDPYEIAYLRGGKSQWGATVACDEGRASLRRVVPARGDYHCRPGCEQPGRGPSFTSAQPAERV